MSAQTEGDLRHALDVLAAHYGLGEERHTHS